MSRIILASRSPRRQELLKLITPDFSVQVSHFDESSLMAAGLSPEETVKALSFGKAKAVYDTQQGEGVVIGGDTIVVSPDGELMGQPENREDAVRMLRCLSGKTHQVITGVTIYGPVPRTFSVTTEITFYPLTEREIEEYLDTGEPFDKAGAYGIQGYGGLLCKEIRGDYFNVVGLPVARLKRELSAFFKASIER